METKVLVYQAYGNQEVTRQTIFSILSLLQFENLEHLQVWVYTDNKKTFTDFFGEQPLIYYFEIAPSQIQTWKGPTNFVHRVKIEILRDAAVRFKGCLFYCDGDTYFKEPPLPLFSKVNDRFSLMHTAEGPLERGSDPLSKKILKFVKTHQFQVGHEQVGIGPSTVMWNAGVLGLSEKNKSLLNQVLELTDQMHSLYQKHVMEQLAFSFYLQTKSEILPADAVIYHYWNQKPEYQAAIDQFLNDTKRVEQAKAKYKGFPFPEKASKIPERKSFLKKWLSI